MGHGYPGNGFGGGNMQQLMKQAQAMQKKLQEAQEELAEEEVEGTAGGGVVTVTLKGNKTPVAISIDKDVVDPEDVEMLEDLVMVAANEAIRKAEDMFATEMSKIAPSIPGLF